jgi:hypothetical protein
MEGTSRRASAAAALLAAALGTAGCCGLQRAAAPGNRDTPEAAFAYVRAAFEEDRTGDQIDSLHPAFMARQGISGTKYVLARGLRPALFRRAAAVLGAARLDSVEYARIETRRQPGDANRPRDAARVRITTPEGAGVFILVDEPIAFLTTDDADLPPLPINAPDIGRIVRIEGENLLVELRAPLDYPPKEGAKVRRFEIHHDWLLFDVESLQGFEEFLGQVKETADRAKKEIQEAPK